MLFKLVLQARLFFDQDVKIRIWIGKSLVHGIELRQQGGNGFNGLFDDLQNGFTLIQLRFLFQQSHGVSLGLSDLTHVILVLAGHDPQEGGLTRAVQTQYTDLRAIVKTKRDIAQNLLVRRIDLAHPHH